MEITSLAEFLLIVATPGAYMAWWSTVLTSLTDGDGNLGALEEAFYEFWQQATTLGRSAVHLAGALLPPIVAFGVLQLVPAETLAAYDEVFRFAAQLATAFFTVQVGWAIAVQSKS